MKRRALPMTLLRLILLPSGALPVIVDRIVATLGERIVTLSDVWEDYRIKSLLEQLPAEPLDDAHIRIIAERLVDQALLEQEMETSRFPEVPAAEVERRMAEIRRGFAGNGTFQRALQEYELGEAQVRRRVALGTRILRFIDFRFRPGVQVDEAGIERYYREMLLPDLRARQVRELPRLAEVKQRIEEILVEQRINQRYSSWIKDLREQVPIQFR